MSDTTPLLSQEGNENLFPSFPAILVSETNRTPTTVTFEDNDMVVAYDGETLRISYFRVLKWASSPQAWHVSYKLSPTKPKQILKFDTLKTNGKLFSRAIKNAIDMIIKFKNSAS